MTYEDNARTFLEQLNATGEAPCPFCSARVFRVPLQVEGGHRAMYGHRMPVCALFQQTMRNAGCAGPMEQGKT